MFQRQFNIFRVLHNPIFTKTFENNRWFYVSEKKFQFFRNLFSIICFVIVTELLNKASDDSHGNASKYSYQLNGNVAKVTSDSSRPLSVLRVYGVSSLILKAILVEIILGQWLPVPPV